MSTAYAIRTYPTREPGVSRIKCAHCKEYHAYIWEVRQCATNHNAISVFSEPKPKPVDIVTSVPEGHFALENPLGYWTFYRVRRPTEGKWAGRIFVDMQAGDDYRPTYSRASRERILGLIAKDPAKAMTDYGKLIGACGVCGRTLTNEQSRLDGIGPVCRDRFNFLF